MQLEGGGFVALAVAVGVTCQAPIVKFYVTHVIKEKTEGLQKRKEKCDLPKE